MTHHSSISRRAFLGSTAVSVALSPTGRLYQESDSGSVTTEGISPEEISSTEITCATLLQNKGFSGEPEWLSECRHKHHLFIRELRNFECLELFKNNVIDHYDAEADALAERHFPREKEMGFAGVYPTVAVLFYPFRTEYLAQDWQSIFEKLHTGLTKSLTERPTEETAQRDSRSVIGFGPLSKKHQYKTVLFQVTPIGITWISTGADGGETITLEGRSMTTISLFQEFRDTIAAVHSQLYEAGKLFTPAVSDTPGKS